MSFNFGEKRSFVKMEDELKSVARVMTPNKNFEDQQKDVLVTFLGGGGLCFHFLAVFFW